MAFQLSAAADFHRRQAYEVMDRFVAARDPVTGLLPLHVKTDGDRLVPTDHVASGLDMGRQTSGLVMTADLARAQGDTERADKYLQAARDNYAAGKSRLSRGDIFVHMRNFNDRGEVLSTNVGEPGKSADGQDNMSRINPRGYAFRGVADLYRATADPTYRDDLQRYFQAWVRDFHDDWNGGFFIHANVDNPADHTERGSFREAGGQSSGFDGGAGAKGNDGAIYAMSGVLLPCNEVLGTPQTQALVKEQMDVILDKFTRKNGMLWENYTNDFHLVAEDWQSQPMANGQNSHVAIGGHTAMAAQQIIEGARQLRQQGTMSRTECESYIDRAAALFTDFVTQSGAIDWNSGAIHNAIRVEEPEAEKRWLAAWGDAGWQQAELLQSLVDLKVNDRLSAIHGPQGKTGDDLLASAQQYYADHYALKHDYSFDGFGNPDVYHIPQVATYFQQAVAKERE